MRTPSILLALALSVAGAAQSLVREQGPVTITATLDAGPTCGQVTVGWQDRAQLEERGPAQARAARICLERLDLPVARWISRAADRLAARIEDL